MGRIGHLAKLLIAPSRITYIPAAEIRYVFVFPGDFRHKRELVAPCVDSGGVGYSSSVEAARWGISLGLGLFMSRCE